MIYILENSFNDDVLAPLVLEVDLRLSLVSPSPISRGCLKDSKMLKGGGGKKTEEEPFVRVEKGKGKNRSRPGREKGDAHFMPLCSLFSLH